MNDKKKMENKSVNINAKRKSEAIRYAERYGNESAAIEYNVSKECIIKWRIGDDVSMETDSKDYEKVIIHNKAIELRELQPIDLSDDDACNDMKPPIESNDANLNDDNESLKYDKSKCDEIIELLNGYRNLLMEHKCFKYLITDSEETSEFEKLDNDYQRLIANDLICDDSNSYDEEIHIKSEPLSYDSQLSNESFVGKNELIETNDDTEIESESENIDIKINLNESEVSNNQNISNNIYNSDREKVSLNTHSIGIKHNDEVNLTEITIDYTNIKIVNGKKLYFCDRNDCKYKIHFRRLLKDHILAEHYGILQYKCEYPNCLKLFKYESTLKAHLGIHIGKIHHCSWPGCELSFTSKGLLRGHFNSQHLKNKVLKCQWPGCSYKTYSSSLSAHMRCHSKDKYECSWPGCGAKFTNRRGRTYHYKTHTGEKKRYVCDWPECEYQSEYSSVFKDHKRSHLGIKEYKCVWKNCKKEFVSRKTLRNHMKIHNGERNFPCEWPGCEYRAYRKEHIRLHMKRIHKKIINK